MHPATENYHRYLAVSERDRQWGLAVSDAGFQRIRPGESYPLPNHPSSYLLMWQKGRVLQEYQAVYVTRGKGEFESEATGVRPVSAGSLIIVYPGVWHRYRPSPDVGWDEYWVGFSGPQADCLLANGFLSPATGVLSPGLDGSILHAYSTILG